MRQDSSVGIATGSRLDGRGFIHSRGRDFPLVNSIQTVSESHPASFTIGTGGSFPGGKEAGA
jgi:hypothetical protein